MFDWIYELVCNMFLGINLVVRCGLNMLWQVVSQGIIQKVANKMQDPTSNSGYLKGSWSLAKQGYEDFAIIGVGLVLVYWLFHVEEKVTSQQMEWRTWIRLILELLIPLLIVANGFTICEKVVSIGSAFYTYVDTLPYGDNTGNIGDSYPHSPKDNTCVPFKGSNVDQWEVFSAGYDYKYVLKKTKELDSSATGGSIIPIALNTLIGMIGTMVMLIVPAIGSILVDVFLVGIFITRAVMIVFYTMLAPVGLSDAIGNGDIMHSNAIRFVKKYLSLTLQAGAVILVIRLNALIIANVINSNVSFGHILSDNLLKCWIIFGCVLGKAGIANKAGQFIDSLLGV